MNSVFILLNSLNDWKPYCETDSILTGSDYLEHLYVGKDPKLVINLSDEYSYNSEGYYCSLLAQARGQKVIPDVETLNKLETGTGIRMNINLQKLCHQWIIKNNITDNTWYLNIYFGTCKEKGMEKIARFIFDNYPCPILRVGFNNHCKNQIETVQALSLKQLSEEEQDNFANALDNFSKKVWRTPRSTKPCRYSLAILYDPEEKFPPSDKDALNKFLEVAKRMNIHAELITEEDATRLMEYDALFIRTTTSLNHYTFHLSQLATINDIVAIDDPESIIRCTNKVYLSELFEKEHIPAPASMLVFRSNNNTFEQISSQLGTPFILKVPDGSFSIGMRKVTNEEELQEALGILFEKSAILLAQEFTPTEYD
ncbi:MAG: RimK family protein, partial [Alistipes sp.]